MTSKTLDDALSDLRAAAKLKGPGSVHIRDQALAQVTAHNSPATIGPLLRMLDDAAEDDETMFSFVHAAEAFDDDTYVNELLSAVVEFAANSPRWASIVLMRVLNNVATRDALVRCLRSASVQQKQAVAWLCNKTNERDATFLSKTLPVLVAAKE